MPKGIRGRLHRKKSEDDILEDNDAFCVIGEPNAEDYEQIAVSTEFLTPPSGSVPSDSILMSSTPPLDISKTQSLPRRRPAMLGDLSSRLSTSPPKKNTSKTTPEVEEIATQKSGVKCLEGSVRCGEVRVSEIKKKFSDEMGRNKQREQRSCPKSDDLTESEESMTPPTQRNRSETVNSEPDPSLPINSAAYAVEKAKKLAARKAFEMVPSRYKPNVRVLSIDGKMIKMETDEVTFKTMMAELSSVASSEPHSKHTSSKPPLSGKSSRNSLTRPATGSEIKKSMSQREKPIKKQYSHDKLKEVRRRSNPDLYIHMTTEKPWIEITIRHDDYSSLMSCITGQPKSQFLQARTQFLLGANMNLKFNFYPPLAFQNRGPFADIPVKGRAEINRYLVPVHPKVKEDVGYPIIVTSLPLTLNKLGDYVRSLDVLYKTSLEYISKGNASQHDEGVIVKIVESNGNENKEAKGVRRGKNVATTRSTLHSSFNSKSNQKPYSHLTANNNLSKNRISKDALVNSLPDEEDSLYCNARKRSDAFNALDLQTL